MHRREFTALIGGAVGTLPLAASAQKPNIPLIGILESGYATGATYPAAEFHTGLKEYGVVEGQNVTIESRVGEAQYDRLPALVADLVAQQVAVIVASGAVVSPSRPKRRRRQFRSCSRLGLIQCRPVSS